MRQLRGRGRVQVSDIQLRRLLVALPRRERHALAIRRPDSVRVPARLERQRRVRERVSRTPLARCLHPRHGDHRRLLRRGPRPARRRRTSSDGASMNPLKAEVRRLCALTRQRATSARPRFRVERQSRNRVAAGASFPGNGAATSGYAPACLQAVRSSRRVPAARRRGRCETSSPTNRRRPVSISKSTTAKRPEVGFACRPACLRPARDSCTRPCRESLQPASWRSWSASSEILVRFVWRARLAVMALARPKSSTFTIRSSRGLLMLAGLRSR